MISWYSESRGRLIPGSSSEVLPHLEQALDHRVDLLRGGVEVERRAGGGRHAEPLADRARAVVAGAYGDAARVEDLAHVVGVHPVDDERDRAAVLVGRVRPDDPHPV